MKLTSHPLIEMYYALERDPLDMIYNGYDLDMETAMRLEAAYDNSDVSYVDFANLVWQEVHPGSLETLHRVEDSSTGLCSLLVT